MKKFDLRHQEIDKDIFIHPEFNAATKANDVALLILRKCRALTEDKVNVAYAKLNNESAVPADEEELLVMGFGSHYYGDKSIAREFNLHQADVFSVPNVDCASDFANYPGTSNAIAAGKFVCAADVDEGQDACSGDSGGPLMSISDDPLVQVGVVSAGVGCAQEAYPGLYARVSDPTIYDWIVETACKASSDAPFCPPAPTPGPGQPKKKKGGRCKRRRKKRTRKPKPPKKVAPLKTIGATIQVQENFLESGGPNLYPRIKIAAAMIMASSTFFLMF